MRRMVFPGIFVFVVLVFGLYQGAYGATVKLKNGDEITGKILERTEKHIRIETEFGKLTIPLAEIDSIQDRVRVYLKNGNRIEGEVITRSDKEIKLKSPHGELAIPTKDIDKIEDVEDKQAEKKEEQETKPEKKAEKAETTGLEALRRKAAAHLRDKEWQEAIDAYKKVLEKSPDDSNALYNSACALSLLGKKDEAVEFLRKAVKAGFIDFGHIEADSDLDNIRGEEGYKKILEEKDKLTAAAAEKKIDSYKKKLGEEYNVEKDDDYKLVVISNVTKERLESLLKALRYYADSHWKDFFKNKPGYYITVLIPKDSAEYAKKFGGRSGAAGFYNPGTKTLTVNLATGSGTMIHEFTHALHYADMEGLGQRHPIWVVEGFGSLYEQCTRREGSGYGLLNWRLPILKRAIASGDCYSLKKFISDSRRHFSSSQSLSYAISRYIFYYLQEKKLLRKWYAKYRENYKNDRNGLKTLEEVYGKSVEEFEKDWLEFLKPLEYSRGGVDSKRPFIGVQLEEGEKGLEIMEVVKDGPAAEAGLKNGDIIMKMGEKDIKTRADLGAVIAKHKIGDEVKFVVKRDGQEKDITVKLGKRR